MLRFLICRITSRQYLRLCSTFMIILCMQELNTKSDYCQECGYTGQIQIITDDDGKLIWECPNCGNRNQDKMNVARRTCGYIGTQFWNQGRTQEIKERVLHL